KTPNKGYFQAQYQPCNDHDRIQNEYLLGGHGWQDWCDHSCGGLAKQTINTETKMVMAKPTIQQTGNGQRGLCVAQLFNRQNPHYGATNYRCYQTKMRAILLGLSITTRKWHTIV
ncbi:MAG: hypothetical protein VW499_03885, partial [Candidatus Puniceispirillum sp.]